MRERVFIVLFCICVLSLLCLLVFSPKHFHLTWRGWPAGTDAGTESRSEGEVASKSPPRGGFVNEWVVPHDFRFRGTIVGGLSALAYDPVGDVFLALSDDKGKRGLPRFYKLKLKKVGDRYGLEFKDVVFLRGRGGEPFMPVDPEGLAVFGSDRIFISSEGAQLPGLKVPPAVLMFSMAGGWLSTYRLSNMYWPKDIALVGKWGVRENKAFEALSVSPDKTRLYVATESFLHQDDIMGGNKSTESRSKNKVASKSPPRGGVRVSRFDIATAKLTGQFVYLMDHVVLEGGLRGFNGLTDFISLGGDRLLTVERAYLKDPSRATKRKTDANRVRLFLADCSGAGDVSNYGSLWEAGSFVTCGKTELMDLSAILGGGGVDNIEGCAIGPEVVGGARLLVLVSDNNFSRSQRTQFLFFHLSP